MDRDGGVFDTAPYFFLSHLIRSTSVALSRSVVPASLSLRQPYGDELLESDLALAGPNTHISLTETLPHRIHLRRVLST